jgi:hypothetical protein
MKKVIQLEEEPSKTSSTPASIANQRRGSSGIRKVIRRITSKSPTSSCAEIPILHVLSHAPENGLPARAVIKEVAESGKWFSKLDEDDLAARYENSRRRIVEIVLRYSRKNLVAKGQIYPPGIRPGIWQITQKGLERISRNDNWRAKYSVHAAIMFVNSEERDELTS